MLLRLPIALIWLAMAGGWYMCIAEVARIVGGTQWLEVTGSTKYVIPLAFICAMCVLAALLHLLFGRLPIVVSVAVGVPAAIGLMSAVTLSIHLDYNSSFLAIAFVNIETFLVSLVPMHTSFLGAPPGNAWPLLVPGGTLATLFGSVLLSKPTRAQRSNA